MLKPVSRQCQHHSTVKILRQTPDKIQRLSAAEQRKYGAARSRHACARAAGGESKPRGSLSPKIQAVTLGPRLSAAEGIRSECPGGGHLSKFPPAAAPLPVSDHREIRAPPGEAVGDFCFRRFGWEFD